MKNSKPQIDYQQPVIELRGIVKSFGDLHVLRGIDLDLYKGENLVVLGRSGTGKSVLIKIISGLLTSDEGSVEVLRRNVPQLKEKELQQLRMQIGFSFQNSALYDSMTIKENLEFPLVRNKRNLSRQEIDRAVDEVLDAVGLSHTVEQMPSQLSGGQKKESESQGP